MGNLKENLERIYAQMREAARSARRDQGAIRLLAVSKSQPASALRELYHLGVRDFGENYAQEMAEKAEALSDLPNLTFTFIGSLQSNKFPIIAAKAKGIQSLGSKRHAELLAATLKRLGAQPMPVHLLVNAADEATKSGLAFADVLPLATWIEKTLPELRLRGVMAIPPPLAKQNLLDLRPPELYLRLRDLANQVGEGDLSLGMSDDLSQAIAAGSTCVRIGTALFGARPEKI